MPISGRAEPHVRKQTGQRLHGVELKLAPDAQLDAGQAVAHRCLFHVDADDCVGPVGLDHGDRVAPAQDRLRGDHEARSPREILRRDGDQRVESVGGNDLALERDDLRTHRSVRHAILFDLGEIGIDPKPRSGRQTNSSVLQIEAGRDDVVLIEDAADLPVLCLSWRRHRKQG